MEIISRLLTSIASGVISQSKVPGVPTQALNATTTQDILKAVFGIAGGVALVVVVIGGFRYIMSLGNAQNVAKAKDTILYALIGLVVCVMAYALVGLVLKRVS